MVDDGVQPGHWIWIDDEPVFWPHDTITGAQLRELAAEVNCKRLG